MMTLGVVLLSAGMGLAIGYTLGKVISERKYSQFKHLWELKK